MPGFLISYPIAGSAGDAAPAGTVPSPPNRRDRHQASGAPAAAGPPSILSRPARFRELRAKLVPALAQHCAAGGTFKEFCAAHGLGLKTVRNLAWSAGIRSRQSVRVDPPSRPQQARVSVECRPVAVGPSRLAVAAAVSSHVTRAERAAARPAARVRACLCCSRDFASEGAHNRMCLECRRAS